MSNPLPVLFLGPYRDGSGYGVAAGRYLAALLACPDLFAVVARHTPVGRGDVPVPPPVLAAETAAVSPDTAAVIQVLPPPLYEAAVPPPCAGPVTNVGVFFVETDPLPPDWAAAASMMGAVVVPTTAHAEWVRRSPHFTGQVYTVPVPADHAPFSESGRPVPPPLRGAAPAFRFYSIGEWIPRKNWRGLLRAYFLAFGPFEPVELVVKTSGVAAADVEAFVSDTAAACGLAHHPPVRVVTGWLSDDELGGLHEHCDVFVQASFNEGWSLPAYDALRHGRTPVVPAAGGFPEFVDGGNGFPVPAVSEPCYDGGRVHPELFTGRQVWAGPHLPALAAAMRLAFDDPGALAERRARRLATAPLFEAAAVGRRLREVIDAARQQPSTAARG